MIRRCLQPGFTLVEILIAIVIGLFLTAGMVQLFVANKTSYSFNESLARIQENGRFALETIASDLRMAGYFGCKQGASTTNHVDTGSSEYSNDLHDFDVALEGVDSASGTAGDPDEITMRGALGPGFVVQGGGAGNPVIVDGSKTAVEDVICGSPNCVTNTVADMMLISDCVEADIFQATSLTTVGTQTDVGFAGPVPAGTPGNATNPAGGAVLLTKEYRTNATLYPLRVIRYHVVIAPNDDRSLYREENGKNDELIEGVRSLQITYGEDTDGDGTANRYVSATSLMTADWENVVSLRVALLLSSQVGSSAGKVNQDSARSFDVNGTTVTCPDGQICQVMTTTVKLRNRLH